MSEMVIVDTEYTTWPGALESGWSAPGQHREIVQIAAIHVNERFEEIARLDVLVRPAINGTLSELFTQLTRIDQKTVDAKGVAFADALAAFKKFAGDSPVICMSGDGGVFAENCKLNGLPPLKTAFHRLRPLLEKAGVDLANHSSGDLHKLTPQPLSGHTHNALHDVRSMARWLGHAQKSGIYKSLTQLPTNIPAVDARRAQMKVG